MIYRVYADDHNYLHVVKWGFSWPGFLVPSIWLFMRGLWLDGLILVGLTITTAATAPTEWTGFVLLLINLVTGFITNRRIEANFRSRGWKRLTDVRARSVMDALNRAALVPAAGGLTGA